MDYSLLKEGNIIRYHGSLPAYSGQTGRIISRREDEAFMLAIKGFPDDAEHEIAAYPNEISPVHMHVDLFIRLGFWQNEQTKILTRNNINARSFTYVKDVQNERGERGRLYDFKGFRLFIGVIPIDFNETDVLANTIDVNTFHALQNYYSTNFGENLVLP